MVVDFVGPRRRRLGRVHAVAQGLFHLGAAGGAVSRRSPAGYRYEIEVSNVVGSLSQASHKMQPKRRRRRRRLAVRTEDGGHELHARPLGLLVGVLDTQHPHGRQAHGFLDARHNEALVIRSFVEVLGMGTIGDKSIGCGQEAIAAQ